MEAFVFFMCFVLVWSMMVVVIIKALMRYDVLYTRWRLTAVIVSAFFSTLGILSIIEKLLL